MLIIICFRIYIDMFWKFNIITSWKFKSRRAMNCFKHMLLGSSATILTNSSSLNYRIDIKINGINPNQCFLRNNFVNRYQNSTLKLNLVKLEKPCYSCILSSFSLILIFYFYLQLSLTVERNYCYFWQPKLLWIHHFVELLIFLGYFKRCVVFHRTYFRTIEKLTPLFCTVRVDLFFQMKRL